MITLSDAHQQKRIMHGSIFLGFIVSVSVPGSLFLMLMVVCVCVSDVEFVRE